MKRTAFSYNLMIVAGAHLSVIAAILLVVGLRWLWTPSDDLVLPVEFMVAVPAAPVEEPAAPVPRPEPPVAREPEPAPVPEKRRPPIKVSHKRITRSGKPPASETLPPEEIERLLAMGAKAADRTTVPHEEARCFAVIRQTLEERWVQPSAEEVGGSVPVLKLWLDKKGYVDRYELERKSGSEVHDRSVLDAAAQVRYFPGLTSAFLARHPVIEIAFRVE